MKLQNVLHIEKQFPHEIHEWLYSIIKDGYTIDHLSINCRPSFVGDAWVAFAIVSKDSGNRLPDKE